MGGLKDISTLEATNEIGHKLELINPSAPSKRYITVGERISQAGTSDTGDLNDGLERSRKTLVGENMGPVSGMACFAICPFISHLNQCKRIKKRMFAINTLIIDSLL